MTVAFQADTGGLEGGIRRVESVIAGISAHPIALAGAAMAAAAVGAVALGDKAVMMAGDFQQSITKLYTTAGEAKSNLQMVGDGILGMSASVGTGSQQLVDAMYWIESAGLHGQQGLDALRVAAQAAKAENANLDQVSIALSASLNAYAGSGMTDVQVMNTLTAATGQGMMTFEQLSGSLKNVLPASAKFGISLKDVTGALATMTSQGDDSASAATHLRQVILALEAPSKAGASALQSVGLSSQQVADEMKKSLPDALQMITDAVGRKFPEGSNAYNQAIKNIAGGSKQMMGFLELTGAHMHTFVGDVNAIGSAVKAGGNDLMGWADIQKNFNFQLDAARAAAGALMIQIGTALLPVMTTLMSKVAPLIAAFGMWITQSGIMKSIADGLTGAINVVAGAFSGLGGAGNALTPLVNTIRGIATAWTGFAQSMSIMDKLEIAGALRQAAEAAQHFATVAVSVLGPILQNVSNLFLILASYVRQMVAPMLDMFTQRVTAFTPVLQVAGKSINDVVSIARALAEIIGPIVVDLANWIAKSGLLAAGAGLLQGALSGIEMVLSTVAGWLQKTANFFNSCEIAGDALRAVLIALGIVMLINVVQGFLALIPLLFVVVPLLWGAATAAIAAVAAFLVAAWPLVALVAGIALVILIVTHWGEIAHWIQGVWASFCAAAMRNFRELGSEFHAVWQAIVNFFTGAWGGVVSFWNGLWGGVKTGTASAMGAIGSAIHTGMLAVLDFFLAPIHLAVQAFQWLYNHNNYFKMAVDAITQDVSRFAGWISTEWNLIVMGISLTWTWLKGMAQTVWQAIVNDIMAVVNPVVKWLVSAWTATVGAVTSAWNWLKNAALLVFGAIAMGILFVLTPIVTWLVSAWTVTTGAIGALWNTLAGYASAAWRAVSGVFMNAWNTYIAGPLGNIWKSIAGWFNSLGGMALDSGANFINMLAQGISNGAGVIWNAVSGIAKNMWSALGFHSPAEKGPGADADTWMPNFITMLVTGLNAGVPKMQTAAMNVAQPLTVLNKPLTTSGSTSANTQQQNGQQQKQPVTIQMHIDGHAFAAATIDHIGSALVHTIRLDTGIAQ